MSNKQLKYEMWLEDNLDKLQILYERALNYIQPKTNSGFNQFCSFIFHHVHQFCSRVR